MDNLWNLIGGGAVATVATSGRVLAAPVVAARERPKMALLVVGALMVVVVLAVLLWPSGDSSESNRTRTRTSTSGGTSTRTTSDGTTTTTTSSGPQQPVGRTPCERSPIKNGVARTDGVSPTRWYGGRFGRNHTCLCPSGTTRTRHPSYDTTQPGVWSCEDGGSGVETPTLCEVSETAPTGEAAPAGDTWYGQLAHHRTAITPNASDPGECVCPEGSVETSHTNYTTTHRGIWSCVSD
tara:strand:- start:6601 stop:7314 length:714 start_codon:yes stop_codon:yes gene_type:complete